MPQAVIKVTEDQTDNSGFCLQQALAWVRKCYQLGAAEMAKVDDVAAANVETVLANGTGHVEARIDLTQQSCSFVLCLDHAGEGAHELRMFVQGFIPESPGRVGGGDAIPGAAQG